MKDKCENEKVKALGLTRESSHATGGGVKVVVERRDGSGAGISRTNDVKWIVLSLSLETLRIAK